MNLEILRILGRPDRINLEKTYRSKEIKITQFMDTRKTRGQACPKDKHDLFMIGITKLRPAIRIGMTDMYQSVSSQLTAPVERK